MDFMREGITINEIWIALIPAYQPDRELPELIYKIWQAGFKIILVDDGSGNNYSDVFRQCLKHAVVLTHPENMGKGRAIKTGFAYIKEHFGEDCIITTMDSDGQHMVYDAKKISYMAQNHPDSIVLGSRRFKENVPIRSRIGNEVTRFIFQFSTGVKVHDTQTGLRAFNSCLLQILLDIPGERYEYEMNVLLECSRQRIPIREVDIETIYINNNASSHFNTVHDSFRIYREILRFSSSSFISFIIDYLLYSVLLILTSRWGVASVWISNSLARIVSASVNYTINKKLVFKSCNENNSKNNARKSALQYVVLATVIIIGNTILLGVLVEWLGINKYIAKVCTELLFFALSFIMQRSIIFRRY